MRVSSARRRLPSRRRLASCSAPSSLFSMFDEALRASLVGRVPGLAAPPRVDVAAESREPKIGDLHLGLALIRKIALEAPPAEIAPTKR